MLAADEILRDRYRIIQLLGQGGMGAVYEAHDSVFDTSVAVKEIVVDLSNVNNTKAQELVHAAFEREAKLLAKINHETFPHVKDYFSFEDRQFLIMELVDGEDLATLLKDRGTPFPVSDVLDWADQMLDGLDYLHKQTPPIIHRDLKPQNLKLNSRGKVKLLDFGIAKGTDTANANTVTDQTFVAATQNYSPIEQMLRVIDPTFLAVITHKYEKQIEPILEQSADPRSDIYALGATLYNLLTAKSPVESVKRGVEVWDGKPDPLENPNTLNPSIRHELSEWLLKSMQIRREDRFGSADEMRSALKEIGTGVTQQSAQKTEVMNFPPQQFPDTQESSPVPTGSEANSVQTIAAPQPLASPTAQNQPVAPPTAVPNVITAPGPSKQKRSLKILWLIPVFGLLFMALGVAGFGAWWFFGRSSGIAGGNSNTGNSNVSTIADSTNSNTDPDPEFPSPSPETEPTEDITLNPELSPEPVTENSPSPAPTRRSTPKPAATRTLRRKATPRPTVRRTPRPTPKKKPTPRPTQKKKNMNCIFTDDC